MATQEGFEWHGAGDTYVEHYLYHLLGDPTMQMWANPPVRFDPSRFKGIVREIREIKPIPEPGDPPFYVRFEFAGEPLAIGSLITVFRGGEAIGRGIVGDDGSVNIVPDANVPPRRPVAVAPAGRRFPGVGAGGGSAAAGADRPDLRRSGLPPPQSNNPNRFSGKLSPAFAGATVRVVYTPDDPQNPNGTIQHTVTTDAQGNWTDHVNFAYNTTSTSNDANEWTATAFYDGDIDHAPSQSNQVHFFRRRLGGGHVRAARRRPRRTTRRAGLPRAGGRRRPATGPGGCRAGWPAP